MFSSGKSTNEKQRVRVRQARPHHNRGKCDGRQAWIVAEGTQGRLVLLLSFVDGVLHVPGSHELCAWCRHIMTFRFPSGTIISIEVDLGLKNYQ